MANLAAEVQVANFCAVYACNIHNICKVIFYCLHFRTLTFKGKVGRPSTSEDEVFISALLDRQCSTLAHVCLCVFVEMGEQSPQ